MPWKSDAQRKFMWARHPEIAKEFAEKSGDKPKAKLRKPKPPKK